MLLVSLALLLPLVSATLPVMSATAPSVNELSGVINASILTQETAQATPAASLPSLLGIPKPAAAPEHHPAPLRFASPASPQTAARYLLFVPPTSRSRDPPVPEQRRPCFLDSPGPCRSLLAACFRGRTHPVSWRQLRTHTAKVHRKRVQDPTLAPRLSLLAPTGSHSWHSALEEDLPGHAGLVRGPEESVT